MDIFWIATACASQRRLKNKLNCHGCASQRRRLTVKPFRVNRLCEVRSNPVTSFVIVVVVIRHSSFVFASSSNVIIVFARNEAIQNYVTCIVLCHNIKCVIQNSGVKPPNFQSKVVCFLLGITKPNYAYSLKENRIPQ